MDEARWEKAVEHAQEIKRQYRTGSSMASMIEMALRQYELGDRSDQLLGELEAFEAPTTRNIVIIQHTSIFRGDHADPVRIAHVFPETATLEKVLGVLGDCDTTNDWIEIPLQGRIPGFTGKGGETP